MSESLRALLHRHADELADKLAENSAPPAQAKRSSSARGRPLVAPEPKEMTPERAARAEAFVRRAGL